MPYTNPDGTAVYINDAGVNSGGFVVDDLSKTGHEAAYAQDLTLLGNGATFSNCTVSSGGVLSIGSGATLSGATMYAGGSMQLNVISGGAAVTLRDFEISGGLLSGYSKFYMYDGTIYSGGTLVGSARWTGADGKNSSAGGGVLSNVTIKSGAVVSTLTAMSFCNITAEKGANFTFGGAVYFVGSENKIEKGALSGHTDAYTSGGVLYKYNATGATHFSNITVSSFTMSTTTYAHPNTVIKDVEIVKAAWLMLYAATEAYNIHDKFNSAGTLTSGGSLKIHYGSTDANTVTLGGRSTHINKGCIEYVDATFSKNRIDPDMYIENGVIHSMTLQYTGNTSKTWWLTRLRMADGLSAQSPLISSGGTLFVGSGAEVLDPTVYSGGALYLSGGAVISGATISGATTSKVLCLVSAAEGAVISGAVTVSGYGRWVGGDFSNDGASLNLQHLAHFGGTTLNVAKGKLHWRGNVTDAYVENGVLHDFTLDGGALGVVSGLKFSNITVNAGALRVSSSTTLTDTVINGGQCYLFNLCKADGCTVRGGLMELYSNVTATGIVVSGGKLSVASNTAQANGVIMYGGELILKGQANETVVSGGKITVSSGAVLAGATFTDGTAIVSSGAVLGDTVMSGGKITLIAGATAESALDIDFTGKAGNTEALVNDLSLFTGTLNIANVAVGKDYTIAETAGTVAATVGFAGGSLYDGMTLAVNGSYTNGAQGYTYSFDGAKLTATALAAEVDGAASLATNGIAINANDLAAKWDATTTYSANVFLADGMTTGNAWLNIDGFANTAANLYGAGKDQDFAGTVNIGASKGTIKNLAAGAALGGKVGGVKLTVEDGMRVTGAVYAGGMGDVTGATETLVQGGTFSGNVFAGALCNYVANTTATAAGDINLTVNGGTFANNIYAGAAVKAGAAESVVHTVQNIAVELNDGTASRPSFCVYGGGYATGTTESKVYAAGDVDITVTGGSWGKYQSGRGIFGGVYTDKVAASVENVSIAVSGGTLGNIYGGGWAQNGGTSTAGNVSITVAGGAEVNNVFGGGCYSTTGGATGVGNVEIVVAGGSIANNIFAGGFGENSTIAGDVSVTFRGSNAYSCNVYGYITPENAASAQDKLLSFDGFTGSVAGAIGGFDSIEFANDTAATLSGAIDNGAWSFDYTGRTIDAAAVALTGGTFTGDALTLKLDATDAPADWNIASGLADTVIGFDYEVYVGGAQQTFDDGKIASGDYAGWGFALEDSTLKFKNLA